MSNSSRRKNISPKVRQAVYEKYHGHCAYCGCKIRLKDMQVDHMYPVYRGEYDHDFEPPDKEEVTKLNGFSNLMPACRMCNFYKSTMTVDEFRQRLLDTLLPNVLKPFQFRLAQKYGLVELKRRLTWIRMKKKDEKKWTKRPLTIYRK